MKKTIMLLSSCLLYVMTISTWAETPCLPNVSITLETVNPHGLVFTCIDNITGEDIPVDSLWVTSSAYRTQPEALLTVYPKSGDTIDLTPLIGGNELYRIAWIQIGECVKTERFYFSGLEWDYCLAYREHDLTVYLQREILRYDLSNNSTVEPPYVDSVWIFAPQEPEVVLLSSHAQSGEGIDISTLPQGHLVCSIQISDCVLSRLFVHMKSEGQSQGCANPSSESSAFKILREGQILILRGDKTYTIHGAQISDIDN